MINGNGGKCKSTANKYALSATDLPGEHLGVSLDIENYCTVSLFFEQAYL